MCRPASPAASIGSWIFGDAGPAAPVGAAARSALSTPAAATKGLLGSVAAAAATPVSALTGRSGWGTGEGREDQQEHEQGQAGLMAHGEEEAVEDGDGDYETMELMAGDDEGQVRGWWWW